MGQLVVAPLAHHNAILQQQQSGIGTDDGLQRDFIGGAEGIFGSGELYPVVNGLVGAGREAIEGVLVLFGIIRTIRSKTYIGGIWPVGIGVVLVVLALLVSVGWNNTAYYPSNVDIQYSLTIQNSSSSEFTLRTMFYVSFLIPFVLAYIIYAWRKIDSKKIDKQEIKEDEAY